MATVRSAAPARRRKLKQADATIVTPSEASALASVVVEPPPPQRSSTLTLDRLLQEVARGAFLDPRKLLDADGNPLPLHELDDDTASAIAGIEVETKQGRGEDAPITVIRKYKLINRQGFVDMGLKALNGYKEEREAAGAGAANALVSLLGSMRRSALQVVEQVDDDNGL